MKFGSVCSGIEAASVAWHPLGWSACWFAEIEPFPSAVLAHHYPDVPNVGDMTRLPQMLRDFEVNAPDLLCGGTPCQAFSVAGLRRSLDDARGNLSLVFCEIANAIDDARAVWGLPPATIFWENVPGVLSTKDNAFGCFLAGLAGEDDALVPPGGKWTDAGVVLGPTRAVAWRVLDAQYFGVAQRRRRVFVVSSARDGFDPAAVLFEFDGVRRDTAPSRETGKAAPTIPSRSTAGGGLGTDFDCDGGIVRVCPTLRAGGNRTGGDRPPGTDVDTADSLVPMVAGALTAKGPFAMGAPEVDANHYLPVAHSLRGEGFDAGEDGTGRGTPLVPVAFPANLSGTQHASTQNLAPSMGAKNPTAVAQAVAFRDTADCLTSAYGTKWNGNASADNGSLFAAQPVAIAWSEELTASIDVAGTIQRGGAGGRHDGVMQPVAFDTYNQAVAPVTHTLRAGPGTGKDDSIPATFSAMQVRRLTPVECERLQGFPDGYTAIPWRGKSADQCPDGPRYKALGNSWAVPCVRWIGRRIDEHGKPRIDEPLP